LTSCVVTGNAGTEDNTEDLDTCVDEGATDSISGDEEEEEDKTDDVEVELGAVTSGSGSGPTRISQ